MLCKLCDSLNVTDLLKLARANSGKIFGSDDYLYFEHHKRYDGLVAAASSGCELCLVLQQHCEEEEIESFWRDDALTREQIFRTMEAEDQLKFVEGVRIGQFVLDGNLASETNFDIARGWMNTCILEHSKSKCPSFEDKLLPSRVISVGAKDTDPFLILTNGVKGKYIALSHCWGGQIDTSLTTSNLQSLQNKIKMSNLPANFRDAVLITRALRIEFLWIDSLCIIQDSKYDWEVESKNMGDVYRNCVLTIAAAAAAYKAADGILHNPTQRRHDTKPKLKLSKDSGPDDVVEIVGASRQQEDLQTLCSSGPLQSRAWTLQEKILSSRILWYGRRQIYWQCLCGYQSADGIPSSGRGLPESYFNYTAVTQKLIHSKSYSDGPNISKIELFDINCEYQTMIEDYSRRNLSYPSDKLPAFSGIAALIHKTLGGHYLAGIWSKFFRENLLWYKEVLKASHTKPYRAPSWSWAVTDERVPLDNFSKGTTIDNRLVSTPYDPVLVSHHVEPSGENPYGSVKYAHMIVDALTLKLFFVDRYRTRSN
ncbi:hypothetical protein OCU04_011020 [Sclerotinia nivalis]|uniref:Heterokaryon incompatibility domain-containing protein n=1 Tax=Sclerotinia nivalis TaxID=352851 RepID=A0A9X0ADD9_9HELO|nr:hypothetical protein OCU04_011020 [Sclerotinia nivalis]